MYCFPMLRQLQLTRRLRKVGEKKKGRRKIILSDGVNEILICRKESQKILLPFSGSLSFARKRVGTIVRGRKRRRPSLLPPPPREKKSSSPHWHVEKFAFHPFYGTSRRAFVRPPINQFVSPPTSILITVILVSSSLFFSPLCKLLSGNFHKRAVCRKAACVFVESLFYVLSYSTFIY